MHKFPTKESEIARLAYRMFRGYLMHRLDFPHFDPGLIRMYGKFRFYLNQQKAAMANARIAGVEKNKTLADLKGQMKTCLKKSEVDCIGAPKKLTEIGWGTVAGAEALTIPGAPKDLTAVVCDGNKLSFEWKRPIDGGKVSCYILQRRQIEPSTGGFGGWEMVDFYYDNEITVNDQPRATKLEYRVIASNAAGQGLASNTVAMVL